jgi:hypothetical protein
MQFIFTDERLKKKTTKHVTWLFKINSEMHNDIIIGNFSQKIRSFGVNLILFQSKMKCGDKVFFFEKMQNPCFRGLIIQNNYIFEDVKRVFIIQTSALLIINIRVVTFKILLSLVTGTIQRMDIKI